MSPLSRQLQHVWSLDPAATAIEFKGEKYLWDDLKGLALKLDQLLTAQGLGEGAAIGIFLRNRPGIVATIVGVLATGRAIVCCAIDNLGKGAAGNAVQNANLALGFEQTLGLRLSGVTV